MTDQSRINPVIARKMRVAREDHQLRAMSPVKALRVALSKAADIRFDLALGVTVLEYRQVTVKDIGDTIDDAGLLLLLDGAEGRRGAVHLDPSFLTSLIEVQTMGQVFSLPPEDRPVTRTDAAIAAPLIDAVMTRAEEQLEGEEEGWWMTGYRYGAMIEDMRSLCLALDAPDYHLFHANVDLAQGARAGQVTFILPVCTQPAPPADTAGSSCGTPDETLESTVLDAPVALDAVLSRIALPLDRLWTLEPGDCLPIGADRIAHTELIVGGRHVVAEVRLGRLNGARAVRLKGADGAGISNTLGPGAASDVGDPRASAAPAADHVSEPETRALTQIDPADQFEGTGA